eukprot:14766333-Ditylum_brightwellii.AAC.1
MVPLGSMEMSAISCSAMPIGTSWGAKHFGGTRYWIGKKKVSGSQVLMRRMVFARSQIASKRMSHSQGPGEPPNVRHRAIIARIGAVGCAPLAVTAHFISHRMQ